mmetsp:Transcript_13791/g.21021  ORF Transcript_13791/g.21021 Transcript_13791/m.21021 type:complete len:302 (+) Transcript_13791:222-1127(+)
MIEETATEEPKEETKEAKKPLPAVIETYVITGGTRGIGFGLARELLQLGQKVFLCGRSKDSVDAAVTKLEELVEDSQGRVGGTSCDICQQSEVQGLWDAAVEKFGSVDVWVNNAAVSPHVPLLFAEEGKEEDDMNSISQCIDINIKGAMHCCRVAAKGMKKQNPPPHEDRLYRIFLMEGLGSDGNMASSETMAYGQTKYAGSYLARAVSKEVAKLPIALGRLQPGMVTTDLLKKSFADKPPEEVEKTKKILNILADKEETVTPWLADQLVLGRLTIRWLGPLKVVGRFANSFFQKRDIFDS